MQSNMMAPKCKAELVTADIQPEQLQLISQPTAPSLGPILQLHRGRDGYVSFHAKPNGHWADLCSVQVSELEQMFPQFAEQLVTDSYFSVNSFWRAGRGGIGPAGLPRAYREANGARYLNACFCDIDVHAGAFDFGSLYGQIVTAQDKGTVPPASIISRSGRGAWLYWLLNDQVNSLVPPKAFAQEQVLYRALQTELSQRLSPLGADGAASDVARVTRVPGSINSNCGTRVMHWLQADERGHGYVYTLEGLAGSLGLAIPSLRSTRQRYSSSLPNERNLRGWRALWDQRLANFETLRDLRGGFAEGCRNRAAYVYAVILRGSGLDDAAVSAAVAQLARECRPSLSHREASDAVEESSKSRRQVSNSWITGALKVTPEEAPLVPGWGRDATEVVMPIDMHLKPLRRRALRHQSILEVVSTLDGRVPSCRQMAALLRKRRIEVSHVQILHDYRKLKLSLPDRPETPFSPLSLSLSTTSVKLLPERVKSGA